MNPRTLYVIGNGFDLWHDIPSSLQDFKQYVHANDSDIYREVEDYLPAREDWSDLEQALADMDVDLLIENLEHFMPSYGAEDWSDSGHGDFQYEVGNVVERLSIGLRMRLSEWVRQLPIPTPETASKRLSMLDAEALFLSFNYTNTLGSLYGVPSENIVFIHGCAAQPDEQLVLGHAWHPQRRQSLNDRADVEDIDTRLIQANDIVDDYFTETFKRSDDIIAKHRGFFEALTVIEEVIVLGHSLKDVDAPYFKALLMQPSVAEATWLIACRCSEEWAEKEVLLENLGVNPGKVRPVTWDDHCSPIARN